MASSGSRDDVRERIIAAAADLLQDGGTAAVTTRAVAERASTQAPTIYRLFGDKDGLLDAVAEHAMAHFSAAKASALSPLADAVDPIEELRASWHQVVGFGLAHPDLFLIISNPRRGHDSPALVAGTRVLEERLRRVAAAGRLRIPEADAVTLVHAAGTGAVLALLEQDPAVRRDDLAEPLLDAVLARILTDATPREGGTDAPTRVAAVTLRAAVSDLAPLSPAERALLAEWLDRVIDASQ